MPSEAETTIAFLFKRSGKQELNLSEAYLNLSMDLKWFPPQEAKNFLNNAIKQKILIKKGDNIKPAFEYEKIVIPSGFQPSKQPKTAKKESLKEEKEDVVKKIINKVVEKTGLNEAEVVKKIKTVEKERNITYEVASLIVGKEYDIKLEDLFIEIEDQLF